MNLSIESIYLLINMEQEAIVDDNSHPKVFVSYSHDSEEHQKWVLKLSTDLRFHGVDVILDCWDLRLGADLPFFMEQGLSSSSLVLCVCSDNYVLKANAVQGGVGYEKSIISADLISGSRKDFVIPIIRNSVEKKLPYFLSSCYYIDFTGDYYESYSRLLARIYGEDIENKPSLGVNPFKDTAASDKIAAANNIQKIEFINPNRSNTVAFDYTRNSGIYQIGSGKYLFRIRFSECGDECIWCYKDCVNRIGYNPNVNYHPEYVDITASNFDFTSRCWKVYRGQYFILENSEGKFASIHVIDIHCNNGGKGALVVFDYLIYDGV